MDEDFVRRRQWFREYFRNMEKGLVPLPPEPVSRTCSCCGYPTLTDWPHGYEICDLCYWEDDGQDDPEADEISGPNHISLTTARAEFRKYLETGDPAYPVNRRRNPVLRSRVHEIYCGIDAFYTTLVTVQDQETIARLWDEACSLKKTLKFVELERYG